MDVFTFFEDFDAWLDLWRLIAPLLLVFLFPSLCTAQQNLFNVPSAEIADEGDVFFQQQFNFTNVAASNSTIDYGLGHNLEVGANVLVDSDVARDGSDATNPDLLGNLQKAFDINDTYKVSLGTQTGISPNFRSGSSKLSEFSYLMNAFNFEKYGKFYLGGYLANKTYGSGTSPGGALVGLDYPLFPEKLNIVADLITGRGKMSVGVVGMCARLTSNWQLSLGAQVPAPASHNNAGIVLELTSLRLPF